MSLFRKRWNHAVFRAFKGKLYSQKELILIEHQEDEACRQDKIRVGLL